MYSFNYNTTEEVYMDFNEVVLTQTIFGKKNLFKQRLSLLIIYSVWLGVALFGWFYIGKLMYLVLSIVVAALMLIMLFNSKRRYLATIKRRVRKMEKQGIALYGKQGVLSFNDGVIVDVTPELETKSEYAAIKLVCISKLGI